MCFTFVREYVSLRFARNVDNVDRFEKHKWQMWAKVVSVYDGDTVTLLCHVNGQKVRWRTRMMGYDSPEIRTNNIQEKKRAFLAKEFLQTLLPTQPFHVTVHGIDKYGRLLVDMKYKGTKISKMMIDHGHAYEYTGGTKQQSVTLQIRD